MKYPPAPAPAPAPASTTDLTATTTTVAVAVPETVLVPVADALTLAQAQAMYADLVAKDPMLDAFGDAPWEDLGGSWRRAIPGFTFTAAAIGYQVQVDL